MESNDGFVCGLCIARPSIAARDDLMAQRPVVHRQRDDMRAYATTNQIYCVRGTIFISWLRIAHSLDAERPKCSQTINTDIAKYRRLDDSELKRLDLDERLQRRQAR